MSARSGDTPAPFTMRKTERGFDILEFADEYGEQCSLQKSSLATDDAIWIGLDDPKVQVFTPYVGWEVVPLPQAPPGGSVLHSGRMHLTREQVARLLPFLQRFVETGELSEVHE